MDGDIAKMNEICDLAEKYNALVMVDDVHAAGFIGKTGRGSAEHHNCMNRVDIFTEPLVKHWVEPWVVTRPVKRNYRYVASTFKTLLVL